MKQTQRMTQEIENALPVGLGCIPKHHPLFFDRGEALGWIAGHMDLLLKVTSHKVGDVGDPVYQYFCKERSISHHLKGDAYPYECRITVGDRLVYAEPMGDRFEAADWKKWFKAWHKSVKAW